MTDVQDYAHHLKGLSPIGVAAARFDIEKPGLSMPQKDRVAAVIGVLDKMNLLERDVVRALITEAKAEWPDVPPSMPPGTQPNDMERASLYYRLTEERQIDAGTGGLDGGRRRARVSGDLGPAGLHPYAVRRYPH